MSDKAPAHWFTRTKHVKVKDPKTKDLGVRIEVTLYCDNRPVHMLNGPNAEQTLKDYAAKMNAAGKPAPPEPQRIGADGPLPSIFKTHPVK